jgi:hypothetical protein
VRRLASQRRRGLRHILSRVAAAVAESTGEDTVAFELTESESVSVAGDVGHRMSQGSRWSA